MKKLLTILTLAAITMTALFAASTDVQLKTDVPQVTATFVLKYNNEAIKGDDNKIETQQKLSDIGKTDQFTLFVTSNYKKDQSFQVTVKPEEFLLQRGTTVVKSNITPVVNGLKDNTLKNIFAGVQTDLLVSEFHLSWDGTREKGKLDAGTYVSNVHIEYTAE